jgi:hypothetical protein
MLSRGGEAGMQQDSYLSEIQQTILKVAGLCATFFAMEGKRSSQCMEEKL